MTERQFPMQDGPSIPWSMAERIYFVYADLFGEQQSLERLAKRGGFGWAEVPVFRKEYYRKHGWYPDWSVALTGEETRAPSDSGAADPSRMSPVGQS